MKTKTITLEVNVIDQYFNTKGEAIHSDVIGWQVANGLNGSPNNQKKVKVFYDKTQTVELVKLPLVRAKFKTSTTC